MFSRHFRCHYAAICRDFMFHHFAATLSFFISITPLSPLLPGAASAMLRRLRYAISPLLLLLTLLFFDVIMILIAVILFAAD